MGLKPTFQNKTFLKDHSEKLALREAFCVDAQ